MEYKHRIADQMLAKKLASKGAILIEGPKWCGKTTTAEQQAQIDAWVKIGVTAAEQVFTGAGRGDEKKAYVIDFLKKHGYILDDERIDALIESAVFEMKNGILE